MRKKIVINKDLLTLGAVVLAFVVLLSATGLFFRNNSIQKSPKAEKKAEQLTLVEGTITSGPTPQDDAEKEESQTLGSSTFFLKPSAGDVISALREADPYGPQQLPEDAPPLKVMWPGFFFSLTEGDADKALLQLDLDENGFGVVLNCALKLTDYPEVGDLKPGQQIWVAGEVTDIDIEGTGTVSIEVEHIRYDESPTATSLAPPAALQ